MQYRRIVDPVEVLGSYRRNSFILSGFLLLMGIILLFRVVLSPDAIPLKAKFVKEYLLFSAIFCISGILGVIATTSKQRNILTVFQVAACITVGVTTFFIGQILFIDMEATGVRCNVETCRIFDLVHIPAFMLTVTFVLTLVALGSIVLTVLLLNQAKFFKSNLASYT